MPRFQSVRCYRKRAAGVEVASCFGLPARRIHHSPTGYEWGYAGSGPADLALNILAAVLPIRGTAGGGKVPVAGGRHVSLRAWDLHQPFKREVIARLPQHGFTVSRDDVLNWIAAHDSPAGDSATVASLIVEREELHALAESALEELVTSSRDDTMTERLARRYNRRPAQQRGANRWRGISARHDGTCAVTGRAYPAGTTIEKTRFGWAIADGETHHALTVRETAPVRLIKGEGYGGQPYVVGEVVRDHWHEGSPGTPHYAFRDGLVLIQVASSTYCNGDGMDRGVGDDYGHVYRAWGREATEEEAAPLLAREELTRERQRQRQRITEIARQIAAEGISPNPAGGSLTRVGKIRARLSRTSMAAASGSWLI